MEKIIEKIESILKALFSAKRLFIVIVVVVIAFIFGPKILVNKNGRTQISISSVLKDVNVISELSTLSIPYNSIYSAEESKKKESDVTKYKYHVAYEGIVTLGIDLKRMQEPKQDVDQRKIIIKLPEIKILDTQVFHDSIETIYVNKKYDKEGAIMDRRKECDEDLRKRVRKDSNVYKLARESAEDTIRSLLSPFVKQQYENYEIVFE